MQKFLVIPGRSAAEGKGIQDISNYPENQPSDKSRHCGLAASISLIFQARFHFFNCFSLSSALRISVVSSK